MNQDRRVPGSSRARRITSARSAGAHGGHAWVAGVLAILVSACGGREVAPSDHATPAVPLSPSSTTGRVDPSRIDGANRITLIGNTHPLASSSNDQGPVGDDFTLEHLQLILKRSPDADATLSAHVDALHDPSSLRYHQWLSAQQFADQYGVANADIATVASWLQSYGMHVDGVPTSRMLMEFTATAAQIRAAFHTEIHRLNANGKTHFGNMTDPQIPAALAPVVEGIYALHDFMPHPLQVEHGPAKRHAGRWQSAAPSPEFTFSDQGDTFYVVAPADFATIYNLNPLFTAGVLGKNQTVVVVEDTDIQTADVTSFRSAFGLSGYTGTYKAVHPSGSVTCSDPGTNADEVEAALDVEWAGAAAPDATIELASCSDTTVFGGLIAIENLINAANPPGIVSVSYGECESSLGSTAYKAYVNTYEQATAEGVSVFVAAGDQGAASCDASDGSSAKAATHGISVSAFASTPYNVAVGGTDFMDYYDSLESGPAMTTYWGATNGAAYSSAKSYIPEIPWNTSCASKLLFTVEGATAAYGSTGFCNTTTGANFLNFAAGSGGASTLSSQPTWQTGVVGLPTKSAGVRYMPDVSLFAANGLWTHSYIYCMSDAAEGGTACTYSNDDDAYANTAGGTSFAAPALAGIQALINQNAGGNQGNPNYAYYKLAAEEYGPRGSTKCNSSGGTVASPVLPGSTCIFHDVTSGDMDVPCKGSKSCYLPSGTYGALSTSTTSFSSAFSAGTGWDYATGLGTINAYNLVHAW